MVAAAGLTAAKPAIVGGPALSGPSATTDGTNVWLAVQGAATSAGNIYYKMLGATGCSGPIGTGTNPCIVYLGVGTGATAHLDIFWVQNGALVERTTTGGTGWSSVSLPSTSVAAGTGPAAVYNMVTGQLNVFYVNSGTNNLMWVSIPTTANTLVQNLGGQVYATPAAALASDGSIQLVVKGGSSRIYETTIGLYGFGGYREMHDGLIGAGAALAYGGANELYLFVAGTNSQMYVAGSLNNGYTWQTIYDITGTGSHSSIYWGALGGITKFAPSAIPGPIVFVGGSDGNIWMWMAGGWHGPIPGC